MRQLALSLATLAIAVTLVACFGAGPGFSSEGGSLFAAPPVVEERAGTYRLVWTQGTYPFYFHPDTEIHEGRLVFVVRATTSSGYLVGRRREEPIDAPEQVRALARGVYFWEPEPAPRGRLVPLVVRHVP